MPVMDSKGNLFDERRKNQRRVSSKNTDVEKRSSNDRRKKDINKK